jgi:hypothetical protein
MRVYFYTHLALVLGIALPVCYGYGSEQLPFFIECIASVAALSLVISWAFPILLFVLALRRKDRWGLVAVPIDVILVWFHLMAVMPLVS